MGYDPSSCISSPKIVSESVNREPAPSFSRFGRASITGRGRSERTRISVFWCVDPFRDFQPREKSFPPPGRDGVSNFILQPFDLFQLSLPFFPSFFC